MNPKKIRPEQQNIAKKRYQPPKQIKIEHQEFLLKVGMKLQGLRKEKDISSSGLAKQVGISRNGYHLMETGRVYFNLLTFLNILGYHDKSVSDFFKDL